MRSFFRYGRRQRLVLEAVFIVFGFEKIERRVAGNLDHPGIKPSKCRVISVDMIPDFDKYLLQQVVGYFGLAAHVKQQAIEGRRIMIV